VPLDEESGLNIRETIGAGRNISSGGSDGQSTPFSPPTDLDDMEEYPPLHHNANH